MANLTETTIYEPAVYQLATTDPALGGEAGPLNTPLRQLANRTNYLKQSIEAATWRDVTTHPSLVFNNSTPVTDRHEITAVTTSGFNMTSGRVDVAFDFMSNGYFAQNPGGHFAVALRCDTDVISTNVRGQGIAIGNISGAPEGATHAPMAQIETWFSGLGPAAPPQRFLIPGTDTLPSRPLVDGVPYRIIISSIVQPNGNRYIRYVLLKWNGAVSAFDCERDTGDVLDQNPWFDATKTGLVFAHVFENPGAAAWSVEISNISTTWGPAGSHVTQVPTWQILENGGGLVDQNLEFLGNAARQIIDSSNGTLNNRFAFVDKLTNAATSVTVMPNGASAVSNFLATNKSVLTGAWSYASFGANNNEALIETFAVGGGATLPLRISVGGTTIATFNTVGLAFQGASHTLGGATGFTGPYNTNSANVLAWRDSPQDFNVYTTAGQIAAFAGSGVETVLRPLYGIVGNMIQLLRERKVL